jgi:hypothetical protein
MTQIDCRTARANGLKPEQYIGRFVERNGKEILLAADEEWNSVMRLDLESARFLARELVRLADEVSHGRR